MKTKHVLHAAVLLASIALPLAAGSITTTFADNNRFTGNMFNAVIGANGITVNSLDVNVGTGSLTIDVFIKTGTYVGFDTNSAAWTLVSTTAVTGAGAGKSTLVNVTPFTLKASTTYGIYVTVATNSNSAPYMYYTNGNNTYSNSNLTLDLGIGLGGEFGSLAVDDDRTWDGTINYSLVSSVPEPTSLGWLAFAALFAQILIRSANPIFARRSKRINPNAIF
jgi:hypothetical protein